MPKVSVIISTYNGERHLVASIDSITNQTFLDFELIIVNDGSSDRTKDLLQTVHDRRIKVLTNNQNRGIAFSQNRAIGAASGEYLALMDHDDISLPHRLQTQVNFLDQHPEVGMLSSNSWNIDSDDLVKSEAKYPTNEVEFAWNTLILGCPNIHTTLMIRRSALNRIGGYDTGLRFACDYDLISRLILTTRVVNIEEPLVKWREHSSSVSREKHEALMAEATQITRQNASLLLDRTDLDESAWRALRLLIASPPTVPVDITDKEVTSALSLLIDLQSSFYRIKQFTGEEIERHRRHLHRVWGKHLLALTARGNGSRDLKCRMALLKWTAKFLSGLVMRQLDGQQHSVALDATHSELLPRS